MASEMGVASSSAPSDVTTVPKMNVPGAEQGVAFVTPSLRRQEVEAELVRIAGQASTRTSRVMSAEQDEGR